VLIITVFFIVISQSQDLPTSLPTPVETASSAPTLLPTSKRFLIPTRLPTFAPTLCYFPANEMEALRDLYYSTNGENWKFGGGIGNPWNFSDPDANPCLENWEYVICRRCNIIDLSLTRTNMNGTLSNTLNQLTYLEVSTAKDFWAYSLFIYLLSLRILKSRPPAAWSDLFQNHYVHFRI
jgi:hypothetical protein